jgi:hypothetical protein
MSNKDGYIITGNKYIFELYAWNIVVERKQDVCDLISVKMLRSIESRDESLIRISCFPYRKLTNKNTYANE